MAIPQTFIQELIARVDIVDIVGRYVQLKKSGANFSGLCPFHQEKTPSFTVSPSKQFYHCFGCGQHGNAIGFLMEHTGAGFVEAVHELAQEYGLQVPDDGMNAADRKQAAQQRQQKQSLTDILDKTAKHYQTTLKNSPEAIAYLKKRDITGLSARNYALGWAASGWRTLAGVFADYADPLLEQAGLVVRPEPQSDKRYDRFRGRLMFPIRSIKGETIGFGGRILGDGQPKYLNSPETALFHKGRELYGLYEARQAIQTQGYVLIVEGYMDVICLAQHGLQNTVATLGTACTEEHLQKLFRFTDEAVFSFDGDRAGQNAAEKALQTALPLARDQRSIKFLFLPPEHDPDSFVRSQGADALQQAVQDALPLSRFLLQSAAHQCDLQTAEGRSRFAANAHSLWARLPAGMMATQLLAEIAQQAQIGTRELQQLWGLAQDQGTKKRRVDHKNFQTSRQNLKKTRPLRIQMQHYRHLRADRALQILLSNADSWLSLSPADQQLFCEMAPPHGPLFVWLDGQIQEHGSQSWAALREALRGLEHEDYALQALARQDADIVADPRELVAILQHERPAHLKKRMDAALQSQDTETYRRLMKELALMRMKSHDTD